MAPAPAALSARHTRMRVVCVRPGKLLMSISHVMESVM
jgi:hypothetical protein